MRIKTAMIVGLSLLALATPAQAVWSPTSNGGKGCTQGLHCYAFEGYYGNPRQGGIVNVKTDAANTQGGEGFITHEMWQAFRSCPGCGGRSEGWVETGQISDEVGQMHPFFAAQEQNPPNNFYMSEQPYSVPLNTWHEYLIMWDGAVCYHVLWGERASPSSWKVVKTYCGFRAPEEIEAGIEVATNREPYSAGFVQLSIERNNKWEEYQQRGYFSDPGLYLHHIQGSMISFGVCCGQAPWNGGPVTPASVAKKSGKTIASRSAGMGGGETLYVYEGKYTLNAPVPMGSKRPKGTTLAFLTAPSGRIKGRFIGTGEPNVEQMRGPTWEMQ